MKRMSRLLRRRRPPADPAVPAVAIVAVVVLVALLAVGGCTRSSSRGSDGAGSGEPDAVAVPEVDTRSPSLRPEGLALAAAARLEATAPRYRLAARLDPATGQVDATMVVTIVLPEGNEALRFRVLPNLASLNSGFRLGAAQVGGRTVAPSLDRTVLTLARPPGRAGTQVDVTIAFAYQVPEAPPPNPLAVALGALGALGGPGSPGDGLGKDGLSAAGVGLLARHPDALVLGHWFPTYLTPGLAADPEPDGFGDIGNFPAAYFAVHVVVPVGWEVVTGGVRTLGPERNGDRVSVVEQGAGLRDFGLYVGRAVRALTTEAGGVTLRVSVPAGSAASPEQVAADARRALDTFQAAFGPYPWEELDVVGVPLGAAIGGMEWPGMVWISTDVLAGGVPGLGDLGSLFGGTLSGLAGGTGGGLGELLASTREFVIAHEVSHQWWHALVGSDSIGAPVVDEPLAQFSSCLYWERAHGAAAGQRICDLQVAAQYQMMRFLGQPDSPADRPSGDFASALQYTGVIYGKAPGFYQAARRLMGDDALLSGLRRYAADHAFGTAQPADLLAALRQAAPSQSLALEGLWRRWIQEAHGDADLGTSPTSVLGPLAANNPLGGLNGLAGLGDLGAIGELLGQLAADPPRR